MVVFFFKQKTAYEMRISDWSSDVCSSDLERESSMAGQTALVVSAHAADFVWRAGGAIALHAAKGYAVTIVCLSFGERGESAKLWKDPGATLQGVKDARRKESEAAAKALGAHDIEFFDLGDRKSTRLN